MAHIAIVGAVGDMQDSDGEMRSLNRIIVDDAVGLGLLKVKKTLEYSADSRVRSYRCLHTHQTPSSRSLQETRPDAPNKP